MAVPIVITNGLKGQAAAIFDPDTEDRKGKPGLLAYTEDRLRRTYRPIPLLNPNFGFNQAIDAQFGGTKVLVHNGIDTVAWTGSSIVGSKVTFNSTAQFFAGSASVEVDAPNVNDVWQFDRGSDLTVSSYTAVTGSIYIDKNWSTDEVSLFAWDTGLATVVGATVLISTYINVFQFDEWQSFTIPFTDLGLSAGTIDALRMELVNKSGPAPTFYLDEIDIQNTSGLAEFIFKPLANEIYHMDSFAHQVITVGTAKTMRDNDKYYGITALANGVTITVQTEGHIVLGLSIPNLGSMTISPHSRALEVNEGNTHTTAKLTTDHPTILDGSKGDFFKYTISDDLSGLTSQTVFLFGWYEGDHV